MAKLGRPYENLVALIGRALHPDASVETGEWIEGPDGVREIDVSIRGTIDGQETFILLECKDWKKDVGIESVDALDSKRHDVGANRAVLVSNSGFTSGALRKAQRKDIMCMSALAEGSETIRFVLNREFLAKRLSVESYQWSVVGPELPSELDLNELDHQGLKLTAWLRDRSIRLLRDNEFAPVIHYAVIFNEPVEFLRSEEQLFLNAIVLHLNCKRTWLVQTIREDVSRGMYDHLKSVLLIPDKEFWSLEFDNRNWKEIVPEDEPDRLNVVPGTIQMHLDLFNPIFANALGDAPPLDGLIKSEETVIEKEATAGCT